LGGPEWACFEPTLADKVAFLSKPHAYLPQQAERQASQGGEVVRRETHMSWVFLVGDRAYKLKKPVRFPYLDFSTLAHREIACRAELRLNRRLAHDVYLEVVPLTWSTGLSLAPRGHVVDWLVVMRRLDERMTLEQALLADRVESWQIDRLVAMLVQFYQLAAPAPVTPVGHLVAWQRSLIVNRSVLLHPKLGMPAGLVRRIDEAQRRFLVRRRSMLLDRVRSRHIINGHGDLRPEHIFIGDPPHIIDCLEFNAALRAVDPCDEIAYLSLECERLGNRWAGRTIWRRVAAALRDGMSNELFTFYRCYRATLRARLAIAHLLEPDPRTPGKWPALAKTYLQLAFADALRLERSLLMEPRAARCRRRRSLVQ
jgi:aminoglycoside phosphotransferase family enzyme